jgi:calpain-5
MISSMKIEEKVNFVHALYDFNGSGDITADEMTILMRTLVCSMAKMDARVNMPTTEHVESLTTRAFKLADKDNDGEITKNEFDKYCETAPNVKEFLKYTNGGANRVKLEAGELWEDPDFFGGSALYVNGSAPSAAAPAARHVQWLRPNELVPDEPVLFTEGKTLGILKQGALADAWFVNALSAASAKPKWIKKLFVATGQERQGRYCIQFWKNGDLTNVFVDDRIPCDVLGNPLYCSGADPNEFWMMLFEKAYAKLHGCYENLANGFFHHGLKDVTGNLTVMQMMDTPKGIVACQDGDTWDDMMEWKKKKKLTVTAMRRLNTRTGKEHGDPACGILPGKVYYVQDLVETNGRRMMKLKNPWGKSPWTGRWSYADTMWEENVEVMEVLNVDSKKKRVDVFYMEWEDFSRIFNTLYATAETCSWFTKRREGSYPAKGGGCPNYKTWKSNPQYALEFEKETEVIIDLSLPDARVEAAAGRGVRAPAKYDKSIGFVLAQFDWGTPESPQRLTQIVREQCGDYCTMNFKPTRTVEHKVTLHSAPCLFWTDTSSSCFPV